jgi:transposase-like protein
MYLFRAVDSYGQTVDFYLSETRDREADVAQRKHFHVTNRLGMMTNDCDSRKTRSD